MIIYLYSITEDPNVFPKTLESPVTMTGTIRDDQVDVMRPSVLITGAPGSQYNYAHIPDFNRYYFVDPPVTDRTGLIYYKMHVDVLQSFAAQILAAPVIVQRSRNLYNAFITDSDRAFYQYRHNQYITIGDVGAPTTQIMVTVG